MMMRAKMNQKVKSLVKMVKVKKLKIMAKIKKMVVSKHIQMLKHKKVVVKVLRQIN